MLYISIVAFFVMQIAAAIVLKFGAMHKAYWLHSFIGGNLLGASSMYFLMDIYKRLDIYISDAICRGACYIAIQIAFALAFGLRPTLAQWVGIAMITVGIFIVSLCPNN